MLSLRKRIFLLIASVLIIVIAILVWIFFKDKLHKTPVDTTPVTEDSTIGEVEYKEPSITPTQSDTQSNDPDETYAKQTARIFVERFLSYSNQNDNQHIEDALALAVDSMHGWIVSQSHEQSSSYQGVTTEVLSSRILSHEGVKIQVEVEARQSTQVLGDNDRLVQETKNIQARVDLIKMGDTWLIEGVWLGN